MGHTVTVKATTLVTATASSGSGPTQLESLRQRFEENVILNAVIDLSIASFLGFVLLFAG